MQVFDKKQVLSQPNKRIMQVFFFPFFFNTILNYRKYVCSYLFFFLFLLSIKISCAIWGGKGVGFRQRERERERERGGVCFVCWLFNVPATCECISGTDLHRQIYVLPHWDRSCRSNFPSHPVTVYWHRADQSQCWPYNARRLAG